MRLRRATLIGSSLLVLLALVAVLVVACGGTATTTTTVAPATAAPGTTLAATSEADGAALYATDCASCHQTVPTATADQIRTAVESGKGDMPSFADKLTAEEIDAIVAYVTAGGN